jgi:hypothetical protein
MPRIKTLLDRFAVVAMLGIATVVLPVPTYAGTRVSIGVGVPVYTAPMVVTPVPVVVAPPPAVVYPAPVVVAPPPVVYGSPSVVVGGAFGPRHRHWKHHHHRRWHRW